MGIKTHIATIVLVVVLHQPAAALSSMLPLGKAPSVCPEIIPCVWAEEENTDAAGMPPAQPGEQQPPESPREPEGYKAPGHPPAEQPQPPAEAPPKPEERKAGANFVDVLHGGISRGILATAGWLDSFFRDERYVSEENQSRITTNYDVFLEDKSVPVRRPNVDVRLVLPQLQRRTRLVIRGEPDVTPEGAPVPPATTAAERAATVEERNLTTELQYVFRSNIRRSFIVRVGAQFRLGPPIWFFSPRYRLLIPLDAWNFRFTQEAAWRTDTKWRTVTRFDLERQLPHELFFRSSAEGVWQEGVDGYLYTVSSLLRQPLDPKRALEYEWINFFHTLPVHDLEEVAFRVRYRQSFWRSWLFFEVDPQCRFPRSLEFKATPGILFRLEIVFGHS